MKSIPRLCGHRSRLVVESFSTISWATEASSLPGFFEETCNCAAEDAERLTAMLPGGEKVAEVDKVSATVHRGSSLSGMLGIVDDLCTLSEQSKL